MKNPRPAGRSPLPTVLFGLVLLVVCAVLAGCQAAASGNTPTAAGATATSTPAPGQVALTVPVELRQVLGTSACTAGTTAGTPVLSTPSSNAAALNGVGLAASSASQAAAAGAPPTVLHDVDGADCYQVGPALMVLQQLNSITVNNQPPASQWVITMTMTSSDAQSFATVSTEHAGEQIAFVVRNTVLSAQTIASPVTNGVVQIAGNFSQDDANRLMRQITG